MDNSPTSLFEQYDGEFQSIITSIKEKLEVEVRTQKGEQRKATLRRVEMELDEADEMISQMEVEIQGMPQSIKPKYQTRVRASKTELARWKRTAKDLHLQSNRSELLSSSRNPAGSDDPYDDGSADAVQSQRTRLLQGTSSLEDSTKRLEDSQRIALETENVGADILRTLRVQRGTIEHAVEQLGQADTHIDRASGTLKGMIRRMYQQRLVTGGIIVVLILLIAVILWEKLS